MSTIGRQYTGPSRNYATTCDVCGISWHRTDLRRTSNGTLVCPDDAAGLVENDLSAMNAQGVAGTRLARGGSRL